MTTTQPQPWALMKIFVNEVYQGVVSELILMYYVLFFLKQPDAFNVYFSCVYFMFSI